MLTKWVGVHCSEFKGQRSKCMQTPEIDHAGQAVALLPRFIRDLMPVFQSLERWPHSMCMACCVVDDVKAAFHGRIPLLWGKTHNTVWRCCVAEWTLHILHLIWQSAWSWACMYVYCRIKFLLILLHACSGSFCPYAVVSLTSVTCGKS